MIPTAYVVTVSETGQRVEFAQRARANGYAMLQRAAGHTVTVSPVWRH